jgi:putative transposase
MRLEADRRHVTLPRLGRIRSHESTRKLARRVEAGTARIVAATVGFRGGRWFVALTCQVRRSDRAPARPEQAVGADVGVSALAVLSTGQTVPNPRHHTRALARLRRLNKQLARRQGPRGRDGARRAPSRRWQKTCTALARQHARVANARRDGLHKISTMLAGRYGTVVVEDLNVAGMLKNRRLSRAMADLGLAELRRQLAYKTTWAGGRLVLADRFYPSSKTCSRCQTVKTKLSLGTRIFTCTDCGLVLDRDLNAARNLAALAATVAQSCGETPNARRGGNPHPPVGERCLGNETAPQPSPNQSPHERFADEEGTER